MLLVRQAGSASLPLSILSPSSSKGYLPFLRTVEQLCVDERLAPVVVYWSRHSAAGLLPAGQRYRELMQVAFRVSIFSEDKPDPPDEWSFLVESRGLCLIVYGQQITESTDADKFQCSGSMDPQIVRQALNHLLPTWQTVNPTEANFLEDARFNMGPTESASPYIQRIRASWPVIKAPIQQSLILPSGPARDEGFDRDMTNLFSESGKIQPIAMDNSDPALFKMPLAGPNRPGTQSPVQNPGPGAAPPPVPTAPPPAPAPAGPPTPAPPARPPENVAENKPPDLTSLFPNLDVGPPTPQHFPPPALSAPAAGELYVFPSPAQYIISEIIGQLRQSNDLALILQFAIESLTEIVKAERGLIWQIVADQLAVTNECTASGHTCFAGNQLPPQESFSIVCEFLSRFPDESGAGVISIPDTARDTNLHKMSPTLSSLIELGDVRARLMVQLRSRGVVSGFLELQQCGKTRNWTAEEAEILQKVAEMLSVVVQQSVDQSKIEMDAREMKLINEIASLFRESRGQTSQDSLVKSVMLVAEHMGFVHSQIYLYSSEEGNLIPQIQAGAGQRVALSMKEDPFVTVFESGRVKIFNAEFTRKGDPFFKHETAIVLPLVSEGERLGVIGLWERMKNKPQFRAQDRDLGLTIAGHLSNVIRADQAIGQLRADRARAALINKVSSEIRQSLKEVDGIMTTLVNALHEHFGLALCVVSLYDAEMQDFTKSKTAFDPGRAEIAAQSESFAPNFGEQLFLATLDQLKEGQSIYLSHEELKKLLSQRGVEVPVPYRAATLVPLIDAGNFKAAMCMVSSSRANPFGEKDMKMIADLADRTAAVVAKAELFAQVEKQAVTDPMTGLYNRRYFQEQLAKEIDRFQRFGHAFSFIIVDLDFLKKINDSLGHHHGDDAIKHIANVLKRSVRDVDTVGRFGGEEFVILLPETELSPARLVAERICAAIREKPIDGVGTVTASLGLATFPYDAQDRDKLFELADQALFLAKHRGRNQVCSVAEDLMPSLIEGNAPVLKSSAPIHPVISSSILPLPQFNESLGLNTIVEEGIVGVFGKIIKAVEEKDGYGMERSPRAYEYANRIAQTLRLSKEHADVVSLAAVMSNLGKVAVPEEILRKPGPLTSEEMEQIKRAPSIGAKMLEPAKILYRVSSIIEFYHENWDGSGYPKGLKADEIPLESRIIALVDAYTALTSDRPYRKAFSAQEAMNMLQADSGKRFDPRLVKIFLSLLSRDAAEPGVGSAQQLSGRPAASGPATAVQRASLEGSLDDDQNNDEIVDEEFTAPANPQKDLQATTLELERANPQAARSPMAERPASEMPNVVSGTVGANQTHQPDNGTIGDGNNGHGEFDASVSAEPAQEMLQAAVPSVSSNDLSASGTPVDSALLGADTLKLKRHQVGQSSSNQSTKGESEIRPEVDNGDRNKVSAEQIGEAAISSDAGEDKDVHSAPDKATI
jgi:diguanylate cyclase (GGDEF)-like protein